MLLYKCSFVDVEKILKLCSGSLGCHLDAAVVEEPCNHCAIIRMNPIRLKPESMLLELPLRNCSTETRISSLSSPILLR